MTSVLVVLATDGEPLGLLEPPLREAGIALERWYPMTEPPPDSIDGYAGVIALGGEPNPDQDARHPWLQAERELLAAAAAAGLPVLGVCLGAELLAQATGGRSDPLERTAVGWVEVQTSAAAEDDPLLGAVPPRFITLEWHEFGFTPPPDAVLLASSSSGPQAFRWGERAWGLQFHPEADGAIVAGWAQGAGRKLRAVGVEPQSLVREAAAWTVPQRDLARCLGRAFAGVVRLSRSAG